MITSSRAVVECHVPSMGTTAHIVVVDGPADAVDIAAGRLNELESRWSRFKSSSEVSAMNAHASRPVKVSDDTYQLVAHAVRACDLTGGRYDPTVLDAMLANGYDASFERLAGREDFVVRAGHAAPGCASVRLDPLVPAIALGRGVGFDPGGIGKGLAADIVVAELRALGCAGAMVNLGGDLSASGTPPDDHGWIVGIEDPWRAEQHIGRVTVETGAVCTSSRVRRTWQDANGETLHHLVDPRTGAPLVSDVVAITVVAGAAWWAEACAKALFVIAATEGIDAIRNHDLLHATHVLVVTEQGATIALGDGSVFDLWSDA